MTALSSERVIKLDEYLDLKKVQIDFDGPVVGLRPLDGDVAALMQMLSQLPPAARAYRKEDLPTHLAIGDNPRQPPVWILAREGWHVGRASMFNTFKDRYMKGEHGYDPTLSDMQGILIVNGPAFRRDGIEIEPTENIHIYNLLCAVAGLLPMANDGDDRLVRAFVLR
jgi:hypothetical protein